MQHSYGLQNIHIQNAWLTIGSYDGVHLGHQQIINQITAGAHSSGAPAVVLTFYPHPIVVLRGPRESFYLTMPDDKAEILGGMGVDLVVGNRGQNWVYLNAGHFRNGVVTGPASARLVADLVLGRDPIIDPAPYALDAAR